MTEQSGIVRRPDFAGGGLTDEEREKMAAHSALWIERAFRTKPADRATTEQAIKGLYRAANLAEPPVVLAPSPFVVVMAGGIASVWWYLFEIRKKRGSSHSPTTRAAVRGAAQTPQVVNYGETLHETEDAIEQATKTATFGATYRVTEAATGAATKAATKGATNATTYDAIQAAIEAATGATIGAATCQDWLSLSASFVGEEWTEAATRVAAQHWRYVCRMGNLEAPLDCYLTAARDVLGLRLPSHKAYSYWEKATINGGFRWMSHRFCIVSDFPEVLRVNARNQPHAEFGPSHRWRDGFAAWRLNGVRVEQWMAESHPDDLDARRVLRIRDVDQRRELIRRMGMERVIGQIQPKVLDVERREVGGEYRLLAVDMNHGEPWRFLQMVNQSIGAVHIEAVPRECSTVREALNWRRSQNINHDWFPIQLT